MAKRIIVYYPRKGENYWNGSIRNLAKGNTKIVPFCTKELRKQT